MCRKLFNREQNYEEIYGLNIIHTRIQRLAITSVGYGRLNFDF